MLDFYVSGLDHIYDQISEWKAGKNEDVAKWKADKGISGLKIQIKVSAGDLQSV